MKEVTLCWIWEPLHFKHPLSWNGNARTLVAANNKCLNSMLRCHGSRLGPSISLGVAFTATSPKQTAETHESQPQKGKRSEVSGGEGGWLVMDSARSWDNTQYSVGETPFLPLLLLTHPWHGRNVQIKETSEVRMWERIEADIGRDEKKMLRSHCGEKHFAITVSIMWCQSNAMFKNPFLVKKIAQSAPYTLTNTII